MDKEIKDIITLINNYIYAGISTKKIESIKDEISRYASVDTTDKYDNGTIESFLCLYKIARLQELNIICDEVAEILKMLFFAKEKINREIARGLYLIEMAKLELNKNDEKLFLKRLSELKEKIEIIDNELRKYHLTIDSYNVAKLIDYSIKESLYPLRETGVYDLEAALKLIRKPISE